MEYRKENEELGNSEREKLKKADTTRKEVEKNPREGGSIKM